MNREVEVIARGERGLDRRGEAARFVLAIERVVQVPTAEPGTGPAVHNLSRLVREAVDGQI